MARVELSKVKFTEFRDNDRGMGYNIRKTDLFIALDKAEEASEE